MYSKYLSVCGGGGGGGVHLAGLRAAGRAVLEVGGWVAVVGSPSSGKHRRGTIPLSRDSLVIPR